MHVPVPHISRREYILGLSSGFFSACIGCGPFFEGKNNPAGYRAGELGQALPIRTKPIEISTVALKQPVLSADELLELQLVVLPPDLMKYPPVVFFHAIRIWGISCRFEGIEFARSDFNGRWGEQMFNCMTNDDAFRSVSASNFEHLLVPSDFGVRVRTVTDQGFGNEFASPHPGVYVQIMAELGVRSDLPLFVFEKDGARLADVINDEARRVDAMDELEWHINGLARYLRINSWQNRFKVWVSFDSMANSLMSRRAGKGACNGIHSLYGLASLLAINGRHQVVSNNVESSIRSYLMKSSELLTKKELTNGGWLPDWSSNPVSAKSIWGHEILDFITVTGHHLEWMSICEPDLRPSENVISKAARSLSLAVRSNKRLVRKDWHCYSPYTHAVKSLLGLSGQQWASDPTPEMKATLSDTISVSEEIHA